MSESVLLTDDHPVDPDDELLVAYLDGELEDTERAAVERRLVGEIEFRQRLQTLQTGWEWLDELPNESTNEKLVESTIELVVADIAPIKVQQDNWYRRNWKQLAFAGVVLLSLLLGIAGTNLARRAALARELEELSIAEDYQAYRLGRHFRLYNELAYNRQWQAMLNAMEQVGERSMAPPSVVEAIPLEERAAAIQQLPTEEREKLVVRWKTYSEFSEETKQEIRLTAAKVKESDDSELLLRTMKAASKWIENLDEELRDELQSDDQAVREVATDDAIAFTMAKLARDSGKLISDDTSDRIYLWLQTLLTQRMEEIPQLAEGMEKAKLNSEQPGRTEEVIRYFFLRLMVDDRGRGGGRGGPGFGGPGFGGPGFGGLGLSAFSRPPGSRPNEPRDGEEGRPRPQVRVTRISDDEIEDLTNVLSVEALADLDALTSLSTELAGNAAVSDTLRTWAAESNRRNAPDFGSDELTPLDRYRARSDRETLDLRPPEEIINAVYSRPNWWGGSSRGRPR